VKLLLSPASREERGATRIVASAVVVLCWTSLLFTQVALAQGLPVTLPVSSCGQALYQADSVITTTGSFTCSGNVMFQAGTQITLNPGFQTATGSTFTASLAPPDFQIGISPASGTAQPGIAATYNVTVAGIFNFGGPVALTYSGPAGTSGTFSAQTVTVPTNGVVPVTLTVSDTSASAGTFPITVTATSGSLLHTATASLTIPAADFTISLTPVRSSTDMTAPATYTVTLAGTNFFSGAVALSAFGLPTGIGTATFSPLSPVLTSNGSGTSSATSTLTIAIGSALGGTASFFVQGTAGNISRNSSPASLTINPPSFSVAPSGTIPVSIVAGQSATVQLTLVPMYGAPGPIQVQLVGINFVTLSAQPANNIILGTTSQPVSVTLSAGLNATSGTSEVIFSSQVGYGSQVAYFPTTVSGTAISASCTASPNPAKLNQLVTFAVTPSGGSGSYTYAWTGAAATGSGSTATSIYASAGSYSPTVIVKDANQNQTQASCSVNVVGPPTISVPGLPNGTVSTLYNAPLSVSSGASPYQIAYTGMLPPGLIVSNSSLAIIGTPTMSGTYSFTLSVTDQLGQTVFSPPYSLKINPNGYPVISPASLPSGTVGSTYSQTLTASGGTAPYAWALSGTFPSSLSISQTSATTAVLSSPAFLSPGAYSVTVTAADSLSVLGSQTYPLTVNNPGAPTIAPTSLPNGDLGSAYSQIVTASGGTGTYSNWQLGGNVPPGLTITPSGGNQATISGTLTGTPMTYTFTVSVTSGTIGTQSYTIMVTQPYKEYIRLGGKVIAIENH